MNVSNWKHLVHWKITVHRRDPGKICLMMERKVVHSLMYVFLFFSFPPFCLSFPFRTRTRAVINHSQLRNRIWNLFGLNAHLVLLAVALRLGYRKANTGREA